MKTNRISNSAVNMYNQCGLCYKAHYIDGWRPKKTKSALVFGSTLDTALNDLLLKRDLQSALKVFYDQWRAIKTDDIEWHKNDIDSELLEHYDALGIWPEFNSLRIKGEMMVEAYNKEVLPKIKRVVSVQEPISLKNAEGDEITGFIDMIVERPDGRLYLMDNKSSSYKYEPNSAREGQQLVLYSHLVKDKYDLAGIGYIVLMKKINKNKVKTCKTCGAINTSTHKSCPEIFPPIEKGKADPMIRTRCNGEFNVVINPTVDIQYIINQVRPEDVERVLTDFDNANYGIRHEIYEKGPPSKYGNCTYYNIHELGDTTNFYQKEKK